MKQQIFGTNSMPPVNSEMRKKHMKQINIFIKKQFGLKNRVTKGKHNSAGKFIMKPDWSTGYLEYEPNPDAAVHELAHLILAPMGLGLSEIQKEMDSQFGFVQSNHGYMKQKRTLFEVLPMAMEQKLRRLMGLPASTKFIKVKETDQIRTGVDTGMPIAVRVGNKDLIRSSRNLDNKCLERLEMVLNKEILFDSNKGWYYNNKCVHARINKRARLSKAKAV